MKKNAAQGERSKRKDNTRGHKHREKLMEATSTSEGMLKKKRRKLKKKKKTRIKQRWCVDKKKLPGMNKNGGRRNKEIKEEIGFV